MQGSQGEGGSISLGSTKNYADQGHQCDEKHPTCGNCRRRQEECLYKTAESIAPSTPEAGVPDPAIGTSISYDLHIRQMNLFHHYLTDTYATLAMRPQDPPTQLFEVPKLALKHDYLLDTLLAITSLHIATTRPEECRELVADAMRYQSRALSSYRQCLGNLNAEACQALYHCSAKLGVIALGLRVVDPETASTSPSETLVQLSQLWKGSWLILRASRGLVDEQTYDMLFQEPEWVQPVRGPQPEAEGLLELLRRRAKSIGIRSPDSIKDDKIDTVRWHVGASHSPPHFPHNDPTAIYLAALDCLESLFRVCQSAPCRVLAWLAQVPVAFMEMVTLKDPLASAICLLYATTFRELEGKWWVRDFRRQLVEELFPIVLATDPELAEAANWIGG